MILLVADSMKIYVGVLLHAAIDNTILKSTNYDEDNAILQCIGDYLPTIWFWQKHRKIDERQGDMDGEH